MDGIMEGSGKKKGKVTERMSADDLLTEFATKVKRGSAHRTEPQHTLALGALRRTAHASMAVCRH